MKVYGHKPYSGDISIYEFLIEGAPNPPDLESIEEDQLLQIQQNICHTHRDGGNSRGSI